MRLSSRMTVCFVCGVVLLAAAAGCARSLNDGNDGSGVRSVYDYRAPQATGGEVSLAGYKGKVLLIVNVASECGFTKQYAGPASALRHVPEQGAGDSRLPLQPVQGPGTGNERRDSDLLPDPFRSEFPGLRQNRRERGRCASAVRASEAGGTGHRGHGGGEVELHEVPCRSRRSCCPTLLLRHRSQGSRAPYRGTAGALGAEPAGRSAATRRKGTVGARQSLPSPAGLYLCGRQFFGMGLPLAGGRDTPLEAEPDIAQAGIQPKHSFLRPGRPCCPTRTAPTSLRGLARPLPGLVSRDQSARMRRAMLRPRVRQASSSSGLAWQQASTTGSTSSQSPPSAKERRALTPPPLQP